MINIFVINGSASEKSSNQHLIQAIVELGEDRFSFTVFSGLKTLPHFDPELSVHHTPESILDLRRRIENADGLLICTPEYVFSIPSGLKNAIEWCISTTIFSEKPTGLITASAMGETAHQELQLIMKTAMAKFNNETTLLISAIKSKFNQQGELVDMATQNALNIFIYNFSKLISGQNKV